MGRRIKINFNAQSLYFSIIAVYDPKQMPITNSTIYSDNAKLNFFNIHMAF